MKLIILLSIVFLSFAAHAKAPHKQFVDFLSQKKPGISQVRSHVIQSYHRNIYDIQESLYDRLFDVAKSQVQMWNDSILEQPFEALGNIRLDKVEQLTANGEVLGYYITYSQTGWNVSKCDLSKATADDLKKPETFANCEEGRITEAAYVDSDFDTYFVDKDFPATFQPKTAK